MVLMVVVVTLFLFGRYVIGGWNENEPTVSAGEVWSDSGRFPLMWIPV